MISHQKKFYRTMLSKSGLAKPTRKKAAPKPKEVFGYATGTSALGAVLLATSEFGIVAILIEAKPGDLAAALQHRFPKVRLYKNDPAAKTQLAAFLKYLKNPTKTHDFELDLRGTLFQRRIWQAVQQIPAGQTASYSDIASKAGRPRAVRAVGTSCTNSPVSILIPCHRVLHKGATAATETSKRKKLFLKWDGKV